MSKMAEKSMSVKADVIKIRREIKEIKSIMSNIKEMILTKWKVQDEAYGEYRWPYNVEGDLMDTVNLSSSPADIKTNWTCNICGADTSTVNYDYIGSGTNHLSCELTINDDTVEEEE